MPFGRELYIERSDFLEDPPKKFFRLAPGREVRLRYAYFITCHEVIRDAETNEIIELRCTYDPETLGGKAPDGRKVKGTIHWVSVKEAVPVEVRLYDHLFAVENPYDVPEGGDWRDHYRKADPRVIGRRSEHLQRRKTAGIADGYSAIYRIRTLAYCIDWNFRVGDFIHVTDD